MYRDDGRWLRLKEKFKDTSWLFEGTRKTAMVAGPAFPHHKYDTWCIAAYPQVLYAVPGDFLW